MPHRSTDLLAPGGGAVPTSRSKDKERNHTKPRSRANQACVLCRARKVRCDFLQHQPCTNCITANRSCESPGQTLYVSRGPI